jgi:hypothetical protein
LTLGEKEVQMNLIKRLTTYLSQFRRRPGKCYGYDEGLGYCLLYGVDCDQKKSYECYHNKREKKIINKIV